MSEDSHNYIVCGCRPWNRRVFDERIAPLPGNWQFVARREELTTQRLDEVDPRYIFFLHWSWIVPEAIHLRYECVCFHMTDVPYGRGGSPLQNLIARGHQETKLTALRMVSELDAGPVYAKRALALCGTAEEIYVRATELSADMIAAIARDEPTPVEQTGEPVVFARRTPDQSRIESAASIDQLYDHIRMLDAEQYPHAFLEHGGLRYQFRGASLIDGRLKAEVEIAPVEGSSE
ncbi:MAG: hypothetical protein MI757_08315 [Pirellulales bacterium]|nr:hypothetical protein [Pirellulales bacterium]